MISCPNSSCLKWQRVIDEIISNLPLAVGEEMKLRKLSNPVISLFSFSLIERCESDPITSRLTLNTMLYNY